MIPYMVGKLAPNSSHLTRGLVKYVPGRGYFRAVPSLNGDKYVRSPTPPIVKLVFEHPHRLEETRHCSSKRLSGDVLTCANEKY